MRRESTGRRDTSPFVLCPDMDLLDEGRRRKVSDGQIHEKRQEAFEHSRVLLFSITSRMMAITQIAALVNPFTCLEERY